MDPFNKVTTKTQDLVKKASQAAKHELAEFGKSASTQFGVAAPESNRSSPVVEAMRQGTQNVSTKEQAQIQEGEKRSLTYLEEELSLLKRKGEVEKQQDVQKAIVEAEETRRVATSKASDVAPPSSRPGRGSTNAGKQKGGTHELTKPPSG